MSYWKFIFKLSKLMSNKFIVILLWGPGYKYQEYLEDRPVWGEYQGCTEDEAVFTVLDFGWEYNTGSSIVKLQAQFLRLIGVDFVFNNKINPHQNLPKSLEVAWLSLGLSWTLRLASIHHRTIHNPISLGKLKTWLGI